LGNRKLVRDGDDIKQRKELLTEAARLMIKGVGIRYKGEIRRTPKRYANACLELFSGYKEKLSLARFEAYEEQPIRFSCLAYTTCEHHWLGILLHVRIAYKPKAYIIGISKIPRIVNYYCRRAQLQERLTAQIADRITTFISPKWLRVQIIGFHMCTFARGIKTQGVMTTDAIRGTADKDFALVSKEFFSRVSALETLASGCLDYD